jgi:hypothetical protein
MKVMKVIKNIVSFSSTSAYDQFLLQQEIHNLLMDKLTEVKYLDMGSIEHQIFSFPKAKTCLGSLCELRCDTSIDSTYFYGLAYVCKQIQRIIIINTNIKDDIDGNDGMFKLIEAQKNLQYFKWKDDLKDDDFDLDLDILDDLYKKHF